MTEPIKIPLTLCDLTNQRITKVYEAFIELREDRLHYKVEFKAKEMKDKEDESLGWEQVNTCWERIVQRERICGIEIEYVAATAQNKNHADRWCVQINMMGYSGDVKVWFLEENAAREFLKQMTDWIF